MYIIRDIFHLHHGSGKEAKLLLDEAYSKGLLPDAKSARILTDFTGDSCRLIFEEGHDSLAEYETWLSEKANTMRWEKWYKKFKPLILRSEKEIMKQLM